MSDWKNVQYKDGKMRTSESGGGGGSSTFAGLDDVNFDNIQNGQVPKYNSTTQKWENANESGGGGTVTDVQVDGVSVVNQQGVAEIEMPTPPSVPDELSDLSDVQFSNLTDHQPLRYNATSQKWENGADSYPPLIYSDEEREVGVWRNGKPLYQKTIIGNTIIGGTTTDKPHGISNLDEVVNAEILCHFSDNGFWRTLNFAYNNGTVNDNWLAGFAIDSTNIKFQIGTSFANTLDKWRATIQYTKTTDVAGSGQWTTSGTPTHHYSTSEQVIGTWIDGKPLYEKTFNFGALPNTATKDVNHNIPNIDHIWIVGGFAEASANGFTNQLNLSGTSGGDWYFGVNKTYIRCLTNSNRTGYDICYVTVNYTKTTD